MTQDKQAKTAARQLAAAEGLAYADALRRVREQRAREGAEVEAAVARLVAERGLDRAAAAELDDQVRELVDTNRDEWPTYADALAYLDDPANQTMCRTCGWTNAMVCPECSQGCGCSTRCTGWRHGEWNAEDDDPDEDEDYCEECGASGLDAVYHCACG